MAQLRSIATDLWVIDHPLRVGGLQLGTRTTVVRLTNGGLWVHSPGPLQPDPINELATLGPVRALVAPNAMHHMYLTQNVQTFPQATLYVSPALPTKIKGPMTYELLGDESPAS